MENGPDKQNKYWKNSRVEQVVGETLYIEGKNFKRPFRGW